MITVNKQLLKTISYNALLVMSIANGKAQDSDVNDIRDLQPYLNNHRQQYCDRHNGVIDKYNLKRPKLDTKQVKDCSELVSTSERYLNRSRAFRETQEQDHKNVHEIGEAGFSVAESIIKSEVKTPQAKSLFLKGVDKIRNIFNTL